MEQPEEKSTKSKFKPTKQWLLLAIGLVVLGGTIAAYQFLDKEKAKQVSEETSETDTPELTPPPEETDEKPSAETAYNAYKAKIDANDFSSNNDRMSTYIAAAYVAHSLQKPEARDYAATALDLIPTANTQDTGLKKLYDDLTAIANGQNPSGPFTSQ